MLNQKQAVQWVGESDWVYKCQFEVETVERVSELVFEGLDTFATVYLNDVQILETDNMFLPYR